MTVEHGWTLRLCPDAHEQNTQGHEALREFTRELHRLDVPAPGFLAVLKRLHRKGGTETQLLRLYRRHAPASDLTPFFYLLGRLDQLQLLCRSVEWKGTPWLTAYSAYPLHGPYVASLAPRTRYRISRFSLLRWERGEFLLESAAGRAYAVIHERLLMPVLHDLGEAISCEQLLQRSRRLPATAMRSMLALLHGCSLLLRADAGSAFEEDTAPGPAMWSFHELLFHNRTRQGGSREPLGRTYPFLSRFEPSATFKPPTGLRRIALPQPALPRLQERDPPFVTVFEARRSIRQHGAIPWTLDQLGELLFRTLRVRHLLPPSATKHYESSNRPYPSAGATYSLEAYLAVDRCRGLEEGLYRYVPEAHALEHVCGRTQGLERLLQNATQAVGVTSRPQTLMTLTARFDRVHWAYGPLSYNLILKDVGAVFQSVYLAATAMGLAACALGTGNSRLFAEVASIEPLSEASVGELILGSPREAAPGD